MLFNIAGGSSHKFCFYMAFQKKIKCAHGSDYINRAKSNIYMWSPHPQIRTIQGMAQPCTWDPLQAGLNQVPKAMAHAWARFDFNILFFQ